MTHVRNLGAISSKVLPLLFAAALVHSPAAASETAADVGACGAAPGAAVLEGAGQPETVAQSVYAIVSGAAGAEKDWAKLRALHAPGARIGLTRHTPDGDFRIVSMSIDEFIEVNKKLFADRGFFETEVERKVEKIGHLAHVWSTFESREAPDQAPYSKGINSIQLISDGERWCVLSVTWDYQQQNGTMQHPEGGASSVWIASAGPIPHD